MRTITGLQNHALIHVEDLADLVADQRRAEVFIGAMLNDLNGRAKTPEQQRVIDLLRDMAQIPATLDEFCTQLDQAIDTRVPSHAGAG